MVLVVAALLALGLAWFAWFHHWWLNSDGSAYLSVGSDFLRTGHFQLPDGSALSWTDRPVYSLLLVAPWIVHRSLTASIWMSRLPLIVAPPIVAMATFRFTRSVWAAALAGMVAIAQPWIFIAGGSNFVPDGLTAVALLVAVVCASIVGAVCTWRSWWLVGAGLAIVVAAATKETGLLGVVLVGFVLGVALLRPRPWLVLVGLLTIVVLIVAGLIVVNGPTNTALVVLPRQFLDKLGSEAFADSALFVVVALLALVLIGWSLPRATDPLPLAGLVLVAQGLALGLYTSASGLGLRNAACLPYGLCLLLGAFLGDWLGRPSVVRRSVAMGAAVMTIGLLIGVSVPSAATASEANARSWDSASTRAAAAYLHQRAARPRRVHAALLQLLRAAG